jgi:hypothetical protein
MAEVFDFFAEWPEKYDMWFETPIGRLVKECESRLLLGMARPGQGAPLTAPSLVIDSDHGQARKGERRE